MTDSPEDKAAQMKQRIADAQAKAAATPGSETEKKRIIDAALTPQVPDEVTGGDDSADQETVAATVAVSSRDHYYKLPSGATRYIAKTGEVIIAPLGVIAEWDDANTAEFEANVKARVWRKLPIESLRQGMEQPPKTSIVAAGRAHV